MTLNDLMPLTETGSLIKIQHGSETIYCGPNKNLDDKLDDKFYEMEIATISSRIVKIDEKYYSALYIYFYYEG